MAEQTKSFDVFRPLNIHESLPKQIVLRGEFNLNLYYLAMHVKYVFNLK